MVELPGFTATSQSSFVFWSAVVFVFGAVVGSFLNVCIHRMPRNLSIVRPGSHCTSCGKPLRWYHNIPLLSWLALRGRCAFCAAAISPVYFIVELLNAGLWLALWLKFGLSPELAAYCLLVSLFLVGMFVDLEHYILPDEVTIGGTIAGVIFCTAFPRLQAAPDWMSGLLQSLIGLVAGGGVLYAVRWFGNLMFGRKIHEFEKGVTLIVDKARLRLDDGEEKPEEEAVAEVFSSGRDRIQFQATSGHVGEQNLAGLTVRITSTELTVGGQSWPVAEAPRLEAVAHEMELPRDAMGLGDVKLMMAIGAFFGWASVLFTLVLSSILGSVVGVLLIALRAHQWGRPIPYGPYIVAAAFVWIFFGPDLTQWCLNFPVR
jgi:leader peptidase (prepilin peptidase)/N-methyltransferase